MRRRIIIIVASLVVLVVPAVLIILAVHRNPQLQNTVLKAANVNQTVANANTVTNTTPHVDPRASDRAAIIFVSRNFAERFGSTSNQNNFANFTQAETYGTVSFNQALDRGLAQQRLTLSTTPYTATVTKALSMSINTLSATTANVTVSAQRHETIDRTERTYYQDLILEMVKVGSDWKVNAASWKVS